MGRFGVILAGGKGERFWPLSTPKRPKPFLRLFGGKSLLQATGERLLGVFPEERIYVVVPPHLVPLVREELPWLGEDGLLVEPEPKDTAFAVAFALKALPEGTVAFFPADHYVGDERAFREDLRLALEEAERRDGLFLLGVPPDRPATGYGYLEMGEAVGDRVYRVARFLEKPDGERAEGLYRSGRHFWNAGIFVGRKAVWREEFSRHAPAIWRGEGEENLALARHVGVNTRGAILYAQGEELIVTLGLQDVVIVREGKVTLVARKDRVGELKKILQQLRENQLNFWGML
ncbi:sugar phosphate nucleotidyltransferase [Thermus sp.]|uniref:mannose-1-phosphate guanylyltransferase n=1 Tax=Thermus sp. TaxID=275 RepID=UPI00307D9749